MSSLTLTLKPGVISRLDLFGVVPDRLCGLDASSIAQSSVTHDGRQVELGELFDITDGDRQRLILCGDLSRADRVGGGMSDGLLQIDGHIGHRLAQQMTGGVIKLAGSAGDFVCSGQRGGLVEIDGNVGDYCCGAAPNFRRGLRGGTCRVLGHVGNYAGFRMRRGTLIVGGNAGLGLGCSLIAGTIVALGQVQSPWAVGMRRGSVLVASAEAPCLPIGFTPWEAVQLSFLSILLNDLQRHLPAAMFQRLKAPRVMRALGDRASGGMGEVLWISAAVSEDDAEAGFHLAATL